MEKVSIPDKNIPTADPAAVVEQYAAWIQKIANRYEELANQSNSVDKEDLKQSGIVGLLEAQKNYDPDKGCSFLSYSFYWIRLNMLNQLGFNHPEQHRPSRRPLSLDAPLYKGSEERLLDSLTDEIPIDESLLDEETRSETAQAVRKAIDRLPQARQSEAITRVYLNGQTRRQAAADMNISTGYLSQLNSSAIRHLRNDRQLRDYVTPFYHVGLSRFNTTMTSAVELAVMWREERAEWLKQYFGQEESSKPDPN